jgi:hypothetical protein
MRGRGVIIALAVAAASLLGPGSASAQHGHTMRIGSDADGGGQMLLHWDFDGMPIARVSDSSFPGLFTGDVPGWTGGGATPPPGLFALTAGTLRLLQLCLDRILAHEVLGKPACHCAGGDQLEIIPGIQPGNLAIAANGDRRVQSSELGIAVLEALSGSAHSCRAADSDVSEQITVDEVTRALINRRESYSV